MFISNQTIEGSKEFSRDFLYAMVEECFAFSDLYEPGPTGLDGMFCGF